MTKRNLTILGGLLLGCGVFVSFRDSGQASGVAELKVAIKEWEVPTKGAHPHDPAVGGDGALWFTEQLQNKIGRVDPKTGAFKEYPLKIEDSGPHGLVADSSGNIWFTGNGKGYIGKLDPRTGAVTDYNGGNLGWLDPATGAVKMWPSPGGAGSAPYGITITPDGLVWYSESGVKPNTIIQFNPKTEQFARAAIPSGGGTVRNMAATSDGRVYLACSGVNKVGVVERLP